MTLDEGRIHFVGIGGAGMSAIAKVLIERGVAVSGSDIKASPTTEALTSIGAEVHIGHDGGNVEGAATVVASAAILESNPELIRARELGLSVITRGAALATLLEASAKRLIVAGTHGKTTTTSMIVSILTSAGLDPTYLVGGGLNDSGTNARSGEGEWVVAESDESDGSFLLLDPTVGVVTNVELDHVDRWSSMDELREAFASFVARVPASGFIVVPGGDDLAASAVARVITFGPDGDVRAEGITASSLGGAAFELLIGSERAAVQLQVPGPHNVSNALAAAAAAVAAGIDPKDVARGLAAFGGVQRRFERKGSRAGVTVVDDYAHHPTEIKATLSATRTDEWRRVIAVFQPHRYSRTAALWKEFGGAFADADRVVVTDVYGAGEEPVPGVTGKLIAESISDHQPGRPLAYIPRRNDLTAYVAASVRPGDLVLTMGAGDITTLANDLFARLGDR
ncbi:MAG TPA: UDP-N-acetylmuramate--L-alanine ligase [Actinomycetota bacterium]|nr:UDP-N-acetylmuramate--L-alanine ligase [Actinomycetota bacterium]